MSEHTQGMLKVGQTLEPAPTIEAEQCKRFAVALVEHRGPVAWADASRIVACWNACDGIPQKGLDAGMTMQGLLLELAEAQEQRDHLLSVVKMFAELDACDGQIDRLGAFDAKYGVGNSGRYSFFFGAVREAIAAVDRHHQDPAQ